MDDEKLRTTFEAYGKCFPNVFSVLSSLPLSLTFLLSFGKCCLFQDQPWVSGSWPMRVESPGVSALSVSKGMRMPRRLVMSYIFKGAPICYWVSVSEWDDNNNNNNDNSVMFVCSRHVCMLFADFRWTRMMPCIAQLVYSCLKGKIAFYRTGTLYQPILKVHYPVSAMRKWNRCIPTI